MGIFDLFKDKKLVEYNILLIDDGEVDRNLTSSILSRKGYTIYQAATGEEGLEKARCIKPDLILLDFVMPNMSGPEVCERLKSDEQTKDIPVIFLTSMDTPQSVLDCFEKGAEIFLPKPVKSSELLEQVRLTLNDNKPTTA